MPRVLITGGRAPAALELARVFARAGHAVFVAESVPWPLARPSRAVRRTFRVPGPNQDPAGFVRALLEIIRAERIDLLLPTCEELFYVARGRAALSAACRVLAEPLETLRPLHDKWLFAERARAYGLAVPETRRVQSAAELRGVLAEGGDWVLKPAYSRFAAKTLMPPHQERALAQVRPSLAAPWVAQRLVRGRQVCTYSLAQAGRLLAHTAYPADFTAGQGATIVFQHLEHPAALRWVERFVKAERFSGQIAFDFIETEEGTLCALECNPRATSGVHLLARHPGFADAFFDQPAEMITPPPGRPGMLAAAMWLYALPAVRTGRRLRAWLRTMLTARDVIFDWRDPLPALLQGLGVAHFLAWSKRHGISALEASTYDIEWNGAA
jgi:hypothetical protein